MGSAAPNSLSPLASDRVLATTEVILDGKPGPRNLAILSINTPYGIRICSMIAIQLNL